jgi:AAA ATPase domain
VRVEEKSLVGRESELTALAGLIGDARLGRGRVALMLGEAGIGKTRLAEAAVTSFSSLSTSSLSAGSFPRNVHACGAGPARATAAMGMINKATNPLISVSVA